MRSTTFFLILLLSFSGKAQTTVSANISSNTTWTISGSPYIISSSISVQAGITLVIEAGVSVKFNPSGALLIYGTLSAVGADDSLIYFTSNQFVPSGGDWNSLNFYSSSTPYDDLSGTGCIMSYCVIEYGGSLTSPFFPAGHVLEVYNASPKIDHCTFYKNHSVLYIDQLSQSMEITNCRFLDNTGFNGIPSTVFNSYESGADSLIFHCNLFKGNGLAANSPFYFIGNVRVSNNIFIGNVNSGTSVYWGPKNSITSKCQFISNVASCGTIILLQGDFQNNLVTNNKNQGCFQAIDCIDTSSQVNYNNIYSDYDVLSGQFYELRNDNQREYYLSPHIDGTNNFWGSSSVLVIDSLIFDYFDDTTFCHFDYSPFLTLPDINAPISPVVNFTITDIGGGQLQLNWNPNLEPDLAGYKIYWGNPTGYSYTNSVDVGNVTSYILSGVSSSEEISITAYDNQAGGISDQCNCHESWFTTTSTINYLTENTDENAPASFLQLYPNPSTGNVTVTFSDKSEIISIYSVTGELVYKNDSLTSGEILDLNNLSLGIYICRFQNAQPVKLVIE